MVMPGCRNHVPIIKRHPCTTGWFQPKRITGFSCIFRALVLGLWLNFLFLIDLLDGHASPWLTASLVLQQLTDIARYFPGPRMGYHGMDIGRANHFGTRLGAHRCGHYIPLPAFSLEAGLYCLKLPYAWAAVNQQATISWHFDPAFTSMFRRPSISDFRHLSHTGAHPSAFITVLLSVYGRNRYQSYSGKMAYGQVSKSWSCWFYPHYFIARTSWYVLFLGLLFWGLRYGFLLAGLSWGKTVGYTTVWSYMDRLNFSNLSARIYMDKELPAHFENRLLSLPWELNCYDRVSVSRVSLYRRIHCRTVSIAESRPGSNGLCWHSGNHRFGQPFPSRTLWHRDNHKPLSLDNNPFNAR